MVDRRENKDFDPTFPALFCIHCYCTAAHEYIVCIYTHVMHSRSSVLTNGWTRRNMYRNV